MRHLEILPGTEAPQNKEETDAERIKHDFVEMPSERVELLANNLARPDGFVKSLILGRLITSKGLAEDIGPDFVRTHRGYYMGHNRSFGEEVNDYLSFKVGKTDRMYAESAGKIHYEKDASWCGGLGYAFRARDLLAYQSSKINYGDLRVYDSLQKIKDTPLMEEAFLPLSMRERNQLDLENFQPPKQDFLTRVHIARKAGNLIEGDQAEVNLGPINGIMPELDLRKIIILIPEKSQAAMRRLLRLKLKEMTPWQEKLKEAYGVDISHLTPEGILQQLPTIYWYPQRNIELTVEYLSTHQEMVDAFLGEGGSTTNRQ